MIFEPKPREINAPSFRDKIVQRNLTDNIVYPALAPSIPFNAFAAQTGKGQHYGLDMLERQMRTYFLRKKAEDEKRRKEQGLPYRPMEEWDYPSVSMCMTSRSLTPTGRWTLLSPRGGCV